MRRFLQTSAGLSDSSKPDCIFVDSTTNTFHATKLEACEVSTQNLTVTGRSNLATLFVSGNIIVPSPVAKDSACTRQYVDLGRCVAGVGLKKVGPLMNIEPDQPNIKSLGILEGLHVQGPARFATATVQNEITLGSAIVHAKMTVDSVEAVNISVNREAVMEKILVGSGGISVKGSVSVADSVKVGGCSTTTKTGPVVPGLSGPLFIFPSAKVLASVKCLVSVGDEIGVYMVDCVPRSDNRFVLEREFASGLKISGQFEPPCGLRLCFDNQTQAVGEYSLKLEFQEIEEFAR